MEIAINQLILLSFWDGIIYPPNAANAQISKGYALNWILHFVSLPLIYQTYTLYISKSKFRRICSSISVIRLVFSWPFDLFNMMMMGSIQAVALPNFPKITHKNHKLTAKRCSPKFLWKLFVIRWKLCFVKSFSAERTENFNVTQMDFR